MSSLLDDAKAAVTLQELTYATLCHAAEIAHRCNDAVRYQRLMNQIERLAANDGHVLDIGPAQQCGTAVLPTRDWYEVGNPDHPLPPFGLQVVVAYGRKFRPLFTVAHRCDAEGQPWSLGGNITAPNVTHWIPLPECSSWAASPDAGPLIATATPTR